MAAIFPEMSEEEIKKLAENAVNVNTVKTTKTWINVWKSKQEARVLMTTLSNTKLQNWTNVSCDSLSKFEKVIAPIMCRTA